MTPVRSELPRAEVGRICRFIPYYTDCGKNSSKWLTVTLVNHFDQKVIIRRDPVGYFIKIIVRRDFAQTPLMNLWVDNGDPFRAREKASDASWSDLNRHDQHELSSNYTTNLVTYRKFIRAVNIEFFEKESARDLFRSRTRPRRHYRWPPRVRVCDSVKPFVYAADNTPAYLLYNKARCISHTRERYLAAG